MEAKQLNNIDIEEIFDIVPCGLGKVRMDKCLTILFANTFLCSMLGYQKEELKNIQSVVSQQVFQDLQTFIQKNLKAGKHNFEIEHRAFHKNNKEEIWFLSRYSVIITEPDAILWTLVDITNLKKTQDELKIQEKEKQIAFSLAGKKYCSYIIETGTLIGYEQTGEAYLIADRFDGNLKGTIFEGQIVEENIEKQKRFFCSMRKGFPRGEMDIQLKDKNMQKMDWFHVAYELIYDKKGVPLRSVIVYEDVTKKREMELAYQKWRNEFEQLSDDCIGYYEYNLTKDRFETMRGNMREELPEECRKSFTSVVEYCVKFCIYEEDRELYLKYFDRSNLLNKYHGGEHEIKIEHRRIRKNGEVYWALENIQMVYDPYSESIKAFVLITDIDQEKKEMILLKRLSRIDALTGIWNRRAFLEKASDCLKGTNMGCSAFVLMDVDKFKDLNDTYGHQFGDFVLKDVASILRSIVGEKSFYGRIGGDEFAIFVLANDESQVKYLTAEICKKMERSYKNGAKITVSLGIAFYAKDGKTFYELYQSADKALYSAKGKGRNCFMCYTSEMPNEGYHKDTIENEKIKVHSL